jgi:hypothetical protein
MFNNYSTFVLSHLLLAKELINLEPFKLSMWYLALINISGFVCGLDNVWKMNLESS